MFPNCSSIILASEMINEAIVSSLDVVLQSYKLGFVTFFLNRHALKQPILEKVKQQEQAVTVISTMQQIPFLCNRFCPAKRKSHFTKVMIFLVSFPGYYSQDIINLDDYLYRVKQENKREESHVDIFTVVVTSNTNEQEVSVPSGIAGYVHISLFYIIINRELIKLTNLQSSVQIYFACKNCFSSKTTVLRKVYSRNPAEFKKSIDDIRSKGLNFGKSILWKTDMRLEVGHSTFKTIKYFTQIISEGGKINPFLKDKNFPTEMKPVVYSLLLNFTTNGLTNMVGEYFAQDQNFAECPYPFCELDALRIEHGTVDKIFTYTYKENSVAEFILTGKTAFNFITCDGVRFVVQDPYIRPFELFIWLGLLITAISIVIFYYFVHENLTSECLLIYGLILEQSRLTLNYTGTVRRCKYLDALLIFAFFVISGAYKGKILHGLLNDGTLRLRWEKISDFRNFTFYASQQISFFDTFFHKSDPEQDFYGNDFMHAYFQFCKSQNLSSETRILSNLLTNFIQPLHQWDRDGVSGYEMVKSCKKTAYVALSQNIDYNLLIANQIGQKDGVFFMKGQDEFMSTPLFFQIDAHWNRALARRIQSIIQTGIYSLWEEWIAKKRSSSDSNFVKKKQPPLKIYPHFIKLIWGLIFLLTLSIFVAFIEIFGQFFLRATWFIKCVVV